MPHLAWQKFFNLKCNIGVDKGGQIMKKKILIIDGHPNENSFCKALASAYAKGARKRLHLI
jgi:hypothetical protein